MTISRKYARQWRQRNARLTPSWPRLAPMPVLDEGLFLIFSFLFFNGMCLWCNTGLLSTRRNRDVDFEALLGSCHKGWSKGGIGRCVSQDVRRMCPFSVRHAHRSSRLSPTCQLSVLFSKETRCGLQLLAVTQKVRRLHVK